MGSDALDRLYQPGHTKEENLDYYYFDVSESEKYRWELCASCLKEDTRCENCGAKLRTEGVPGIAVEMRPCGFADYPPDEHTAERCKRRRELAIESGLLPSVTVDETKTAQYSPETFDY